MVLMLSCGSWSASPWLIYGFWDEAITCLMLGWFFFPCVCVTFTFAVTRFMHEARRCCWHTTYLHDHKICISNQTGYNFNDFVARVCLFEPLDDVWRHKYEIFRRLDVSLITAASHRWIKQHLVCSSVKRNALDGRRVEGKPALFPRGDEPACLLT